MKANVRKQKITPVLILAFTYCALSVQAEEAKPASQVSEVAASNQPASPTGTGSGKVENLIKERYLQYHQTLLKANSFDELMPFRSTKMQAEMEKKKAEALAKGGDAGNKMMAGLFGMVKAMEPRKVTVTAVVVKGDSAELSVTASDAGELPDAMNKGIGSMANSISASLGVKPAAIKPMRSTTTGKISMIKENGSWLVGEENWATKVTNLTPAQEAKRNAEDAQKRGLSSWCAPAASLAFPQKPAAGRIHGQPFVVENAELSDDILTLRQGRDFFADREFMIFVFGLDGKLEGQQIVVKDGAPVGKSSCHVHMKWLVPGKSLPETAMFMPPDGYGIRLAFGNRDAKTGLLPGYIVLRMPDKEQSFVQGYFYAKRK